MKMVRDIFCCMCYFHMSLIMLFAFLAQFGCLAWSPCEKKLLYVAEKKRVEPHPSNEDGGQVLLEEQVR